MAERITTPRLILKTLSATDIPGLLEFYHRNSKFLKPWIPEYDKDYYTYEYQLRKLEYEKNLRECGSEYRYNIFKKDDPERVIGNIAVSNIIRGILQSAFLGYSVDENENGKGFATEAVKEIIDFSFRDIRLHRIEANVIPSNTASVRVLEKLNFTKEGYSENYLKINGKWQDHIRFALINQNYDQ
ncbi:MAG TPA: GNAT family N-acetyltransferase [Ignavibacteria bacterium]|nr:GNAT family N-acetyltransferase [Ignavibacteria bacterium]